MYHVYTAGYLLEDKATQLAAVFEKLYQEKKPEPRAKYFARMNSIEYDIIRCIQEERFLGHERYVSMTEKDYTDNLIKIMSMAKQLAMPDMKPLTKDQQKVMAIYKNRLIEKSNKYLAMCKNCGYTSNNTDHFLGFYPHQPMNRDDRNDAFYNMNAGHDAIELIIRKLSSRKRSNILFSNAPYFESSIVFLKKELKDKVKFYATYFSDTAIMNTEMRKNLERVAIGEDNSYRIQNKVFDLVIDRFNYKPIYHDESRQEVVGKSLIERKINRCKGYLCDGGVLLMTVPTFLLRNKELLAIRSNYEYLWSIELPNNMNAPVHYVMIALRYHFMQTEEEREKTFQALRNMKPAPEVTAELAESTISGISKRPAKEIRLMEGDTPDEGFLQIILDESPLAKFPSRKKEEPIRPLLPLKKGQIGQILASGRLDGVIDEGDGFKHVIRGRVYKGSRERETLDDRDPKHVVKTVETLENNMIEINLLAGNGTYKHVVLTK